MEYPHDGALAFATIPVASNPVAEHQPRKLIFDLTSFSQVESSILSSACASSFCIFFEPTHDTPRLSRQKPARTGPAEGQSGLLRCIWFVDAGTGLASPQDFPEARRGVNKPSTLAPGGSWRRTADAPLTRKANHDAATRASQSSALRRRAAGGLASPQRSHSARPGPIYLEVRVPYPRAETAKSTVTPGTGLASPQPSGDARTTC